MQWVDVNDSFVPMPGGRYYYVDANGDIYCRICDEPVITACIDDMNINIGNCFMTYEQAEVNADVIKKRINKYKEILKQHREEIWKCDG